MTREEFNQWWNDYQAKFPGAAKWAATISEDQRREIFPAWRGVLSAVSLADALEVNRLMRSGAVPEVGSYDSDREKIGFVIRSEADVLGRSRRSKSVPDWQAESYRCSFCRDTGLVEVFRREWLAWLASQDAIPTNYKAASEAGWRRGRPTQMVLCSCSTADTLIYHGPIEKAPPTLAKSRIWITNGREPVRYSEDRFYRVPLGKDFHPSEWSLATEWYSGRVDAVRGERIYDEFEQWNSGPVTQPQIEFKHP